MIQNILSDEFSVGQNLAETLGSENSPEGGGGQQFGALGVVGDVADGGQRVPDAVVDDGVDGYGHGVLGKDLLRRNVEGDGPQVGNDNLVHTRNDKEQSGSNGASSFNPTELENDRSFIFLIYEPTIKLMIRG